MHHSRWGAPSYREINFLTQNRVLEVIRDRDFPVQERYNPSIAELVAIVMTDSPSIVSTELESLPREVRVAHVRYAVESLRMADEIADKGYLITSAELADLMDINAGAVTSRGDHWVWRNWVISRVRREGNQILWQLERVD
ncbi:MAG: hypothetical protein NW224_30300 [Leptolyngbyaceae cyanobacterium bins.302]|nr:hypothetical protein [Leptolyngbyaceae cyanobacterium bins.302]